MKEESPGAVTLPKWASPSSLMDFKTCPQLYSFRHIQKLKEPASELMVRGSMVHQALEQVGPPWPRQTITLLATKQCVLDHV